MNRFYKVIWSILLLWGSTKALAQQAEAPLVMEGGGKDYSFGKILQGRPVSQDIKLVNTGTAELRIENAQASCGCTTPVWSYAPIKPGESTILKVGYNAAAEGKFEKVVTLHLQGGQMKTLTISGEVYKAPATSAPLNSSIQQIKQRINL
jgi:hypothetical protein